MENLLNNQLSDSKQMEIFNILDRVKISDKNREVAVEFFDISKEMNLELLEKVSFQLLTGTGDWGAEKKSRTLIEHSNEEDKEYVNRYILFLDAVGLHTVGDMFVYGMLNIFEKNKNDVNIQKVTHALSLKYSPETVQSKMAALLIGPTDTRHYLNDKGYYPKVLQDMAEKNPIILIRAAKDCCQEEYIEDKMKLYLLALVNIEQLETYNGEDMEDIKSGIEFVKDQAVNFPLTNMEAFYNIMSVSFVVIRYDKKIKEIIKKRIENKEQKFLTAVLENVPKQYVADHMDILSEIIGIEKSPNTVCDCIKTVLSEFELERYNTSPDKQHIFLAYIAKKYPEEFIKTMNSAEKIGRKKSSGKVCIYNYYERMYEILEQANPNSIKDYHIEFEADVLRYAAESEKIHTRKYKEEVFRFLCGEDNIFNTDEDYEKLKEDFKTYYINNTYIVDACIRCNDKFKKRYYALKAVQLPHYCAYDMPKDEKISDMLISEKIPIATRFRVYEEFYNAYYDESKDNFENEIVEKMLFNKESWGGEYEKCCLKGGVFTKKVYLRYLEGINDSDKCKDTILAMSFDSSKEIRKLVVEIVSKHKEYEEDVLKLLKAKKQAVREVAVDIIAIWGAGSYTDILLKAQENEKSVKLAEKISGIVYSAGISTEKENDEISPLQIVENLHKGGRNKKILWLYEAPNRAVHFKNGKEADEKYMQALLLCYANMTTLGMNQSAILLTKELNEEELNQYSLGIFTKWKEAGAEAKKKWVLYFTSIHGGRNMIEVLLHCIKEWAENSRGAIAAEAVRALALNGSSEALMHVDNMAHKFKHKQVKGAAIEALDNAAEEFGITTEELADRIVPDLGFNETMERIFDYGARKFKVYLSPSLELEIFDEDNKKRKTMPAPSKKDDEETAKQSNAEFKQLKKQLKSVTSIQKLRLESSLLADRRWTMEAWQNLFVKNPVMHSFAIGLIWAVYEGDKLVQTFRYMEDGSFNTSEEEEYTLSENTIIGLVHPIDLSNEELLAWKEQLEDYEIIQPIKQLERNVYSIQEEEVGKFDLNRFHGRTISGMALLGRLEKLGWYKGSIQDAGWYDTFYREDVVRRIKKDDGTVQLIGNAAELHFSGMGVGYYDDEEVTVENIRFYTPGTIKRGSYEYDEADDNKAMKLEQVNPRYLSEIINQLEMILKETKIN
ncbi:MAG: DUF4132 domain-containing protein [Lachnospiraceae bacterium]|nr:DUF4132 domain-containing protein [Lachnospiraceae bacterium]